MFVQRVLAALVITTLAAGPALARAQSQDKAPGSSEAIVHPEAGVGQAAPGSGPAESDLRATAARAAMELVREEADHPGGSEQGSVAEQRRRAEQRRHGLYKVYAGAGLAGLGAILAATSSESICVNDPFGGDDLCATARSNGRLYGGLGMVGVGAFLVWMGANDRKNASAVATTSGEAEGLSVRVGRRTSVRYRLTW